MAEPDNMVLVLLREMRAEMNGRFDAVDARFERLDKKLDSVKQAAFGESLIGRYVMAEMDERFEKIEHRLDTLENR